MLQRKCYKDCTFLLYSILTRACYGFGPFMDNNTDNHCDNHNNSTATNADTLHTCSRQHTNEYVTIDYMDWSSEYILD
jgi:hypothetical protein